MLVYYAIGRPEAVTGTCCSHRLGRKGGVFVEFDRSIACHVGDVGGDCFVFHEHFFHAVWNVFLVAHESDHFEP